MDVNLDVNTSLVYTFFPYYLLGTNVTKSNLIHIDQLKMFKSIGFLKKNQSILVNIS